MDLAPEQQSILYVASHGMEDSYRATLIFAAAKAAKAQHAGTVRVALLGEATWLASTAIQENFSLGQVKNRRGRVVRAPLFDLIEECVGQGVEVGV